MSTEITIHKLPTLTDLYSDKEEVIKQNKLNIILNADPKVEWVKDHPYVKNLKYLPIERVEYLLTMIFGKWEVEIKDVKLIANSVVVTVRLKVRDPLNQGEWVYQDGVGAAPIQTKKDAGAINFDQMSSSAIQIGAPAAESYAIKDAAEKFGKIFGKDLNRKDVAVYVDRLHASIDAVQKLTIIEDISKCNDEQALKEYWITLSEKERQDSDIIQAFETAKFSLEPTIV